MKLTWHNSLPIIEIDGTSVNSSADFHKLRVNVAQRYSTILSQPSTTKDTSFWLRARMINHCFAHPKPHLQTEVRAIIHYSPKAIVPTTSPWDDNIALICSDLNTTTIIPAIDDPPPFAKEYYYLRSNFEIGAGRLSRGMFNASSWRTPVVPTLEYVLNGTLGYMAADGKDDKNGMLLRADWTVDVLIDNFDDGFVQTYYLLFHVHKQEAINLF